MHAPKVIGTILKHDRKINTYKIALLRAINDLALEYPDLTNFNTNIAIPLRVIAQHWLAYFWAFCDPQQPILQGQQAVLNQVLRNDIAFRPALTALRAYWETTITHQSAPHDGFMVMNELGISRRRMTFSVELLRLYHEVISKIGIAIQQPVRYAGPGNWSVFHKPRQFHELKQNTIAIPGTHSVDLCIVVDQQLWLGFQEISLYVEALCLHEWSMFTEGKNPGTDYDRGYVYRLLTARPDNRRPLDWERNKIDLILMEGGAFTCPWTEKTISAYQAYDLDHIIPVSLYPINEFWNLVPADPYFNQHKKRDRLPGSDRLKKALPHLVQTYRIYDMDQSIHKALREDVHHRFASLKQDTEFHHALGSSVESFIHKFADARNVARF